MLMYEKGVGEYFSDENGLSAWSETLKQRAENVIANIVKLRELGNSIFPAHRSLAPLSEFTALETKDRDYYNVMKQVSSYNEWTLGYGLGRSQEGITNAINSQNIDENSLIGWENSYNDVSLSNPLIREKIRLSDIAENYFNDKYVIRVSNSNGVRYVDVKPAEMTPATIQSMNIILPKATQQETTATIQSETIKTSVPVVQSGDITNNSVITSPEKIQNITSQIITSAKSQAVKNPLLLIGIGLALVKIGLMIFKPHKA